ncbi:hypothetical protein P4S72_07685 [Vibrio sp. PP-XX7]
MNAAIASPELARLWLSHYMTIVQQLCVQDNGLAHHRQNNHTQNNHSQNNHTQAEQTLRQVMVAIDPYQGRVIDAHGIPLFAGALDGISVATVANVLPE